MCRDVDVGGNTQAARISRGASCVFCLRKENAHSSAENSRGVESGIERVIPSWRRREEAKDGPRQALAAGVGLFRIKAIDHFLQTVELVSVVAVRHTVERRTFVPSSLAARLQLLGAASTFAARRQL